MSSIKDRVDGRFAGSTTVDSAAVWDDVGLDDLDTTTDSATPTQPVALADLFVYETSGENPAYVLLRAHGEQADEDYTGAFIIPAGTGRAFGVYFPDVPVTTISVSGTARVEAIYI